MIETNNIPQHIAIIMDGNGRWANERGKERSFGHQAGVEAVRKITAECTRLGVKYLTLYTFSTENWGRPADEVAALMGLVLSSLEDEIFMKNNVRFRVIGDVKRLPDAVQQKLRETEEHTAAAGRLRRLYARLFKTSTTREKISRGRWSSGRQVASVLRTSRKRLSANIWLPTSCQTPTC